MGYAIIKDLAGNKNYALNRLIQNLIPKDSSIRVYIEDAEGTKSFSYGEGVNGIYKLASVNLGNATLPYEYVLAQSKTGVSVDSISGVITVTSDLASETNVTVNLIPVFNTYYPVASHTASYKLQTTVLVAPPELETPVIHTDFYTITINKFSYDNDAASTSNSQTTPTLNYTLKKNTEPSSETCTVRYSTENGSDATLAVDTGTVTFMSANSSTTNKKSYVVKVTITAPDGETTATATATAYQATATPSTKTLQSISVSNTTRAELSKIETITATAHYSDNSSEDVTATVTPNYVMPGSNTYTATYSDVPTTFTISSTALPTSQKAAVAFISDNTSITESAETIYAHAHSDQYTQFPTSGEGGSGSLEVGSTNNNYARHIALSTTSKLYYLIDNRTLRVYAFMFNGAANSVVPLGASTPTIDAGNSDTHPSPISGKTYNYSNYYGAFVDDTTLNRALVVINPALGLTITAFVSMLGDLTGSGDKPSPTLYNVTARYLTEGLLIEG